MFRSPSINVQAWFNWLATRDGPPFASPVVGLVAGLLGFAAALLIAVWL